MTQPPPSDVTLKMLSDLRLALAGIGNSMDLIAVHLLSGQTCDASTVTPWGYMGPCALRIHHEGPLHKDAQQQVWSDGTPSGYYDPNPSYPSQQELQDLTDDAVENPSFIPQSRPNRWVDCDEEYKKNVTVMNCENLPRLPAEQTPDDKIPGSADAPHLHPLDFEVEGCQRAMNGSWVQAEGTSGSLPMLLHLENTEIEGWWRHYGQRR